MYRKANINIIRIGLQPTDNINVNGDIIAGPFHPSFRELVESSLLNDKIYDVVSKLSGNIEIGVSNKVISKLYADKKRYFSILNDKITPRKLSIVMDNSIAFNNIRVKVGEEQINLSI